MTRHGIDLSGTAIQEFCRKWKITNLSVFGSILGQEFNPNSDLDFLAEFDEDEDWDILDEIRMQDELETIVGRKVDLMSRSALDAGGNPRFKREVLTTAEKVYAS